MMRGQVVVLGSFMKAGPLRSSRIGCTTRRFSQSNLLSKNKNGLYTAVKAVFVGPLGIEPRTY